MRTAYQGYLLAEFAGAADGTGSDYLPQRLAGVLPSDTALAQDGRGMAALWAYRERLAEAIATAGIPHKIDVAIPAAALGPFRAELDDVVRAAAAAIAPAGGGGRAGPAGMPEVMCSGTSASGTCT
jgi:FAD/FMN-containing dehydrogenase